MMRRVALLGNPNVGKSTIFNALTGMRQHTGNWAGVTVSYTQGYFSYEDIEFSVIDLPGIYSFDTRSEEENVTKQFVESLDYDILVLICDATCLERGLHLLKQTTRLLLSALHTTQKPLNSLESVSAAETTFCHTCSSIPQLVLCVNLCDEAAKKGILIDFSTLEKELGIPSVPSSARERGGLDRLKDVLSTCVTADSCRYPLLYSDYPHVDAQPETGAQTASTNFQSPMNLFQGLTSNFMPDILAAQTVCYTDMNYRSREERLDQIFTGPVTGTFCMLLLLTGVFWLTITGANYPSQLLWDLLFRFESVLTVLAVSAGLPDWFIGAFIYGMYRVVAWIVSVMLPPMAIFFPLFTLLEDFGLLPRIAYNMDGAFHACGVCGKQCLTMAMGLGCNAAGVTGCRIIDSPRERLIAILTNSLVPCNGRFPLLITMITIGGMGISVAGPSSPWTSDLISALFLTGFILLGIVATMATSWFLSHTLLKGLPSSFTLELPPYRRPQITKVIVRSICERTLLVLGRAVIVAAPAGLLIWVMANISTGMLLPALVNFSIPGAEATLQEAPTLLALFSGILDPLGRWMGLDGVILMAFILGFPANEIVLPIILMAYMQSGQLAEMEGTSALFSLLEANGWTFKTCICMAVFSLFHWPCSTTCLTIRKETGSWKWTAVAVLIPTLLGCISCMLISSMLS